MQNQQTGKWLLVIIFILIAVTIFLRVNVEVTNYTSPDSKFYLRVANNLVQGKGLVAPDAYPFAPDAEEIHFAIWPAAYPVSIAAVSLVTGLSTLMASKVVNLIFLGLLFWLMYKWLGNYAWFPALHFFSFGKLEVLSYTWSEGPFIFFIFLLCYFLHKDYVLQRKNHFLFLQIFLSLIGIFLFRYAGLIYYFFVSLFLLYYVYKKQFYRAFHYFTALLLASAFAITYFIINRHLNGLYTGTIRVFPERESYGYFFKLLLQGLANETFVARNYYFSGYTDYLFVALLILQLAVVYLLFRYRKLITSPVFDSKAIMLLFVGLFYLVAITILRKISPFDPFNYRILAPYSAPVFIALLYMITQHKAYFQKTYKWIGAFMLLSLLMNLPKVFLLEKLTSLF